MEDVVDRAGNVDVASHVELDEREGPAADVCEIVCATGQEVIDTKDLESLGEEVIAEVRADEPRSPGDQDTPAAPGPQPRGSACASPHLRYATAAQRDCIVSTDDTCCDGRRA